MELRFYMRRSGSFTLIASDGSALTDGRDSTGIARASVLGHLSGDVARATRRRTHHHHRRGGCCPALRRGIAAAAGRRRSPARCWIIRGCARDCCRQCLSPSVLQAARLRRDPDFAPLLFRWDGCSGTSERAGGQTAYRRSPRIQWLKPLGTAGRLASAAAYCCQQAAHCLRSIMRYTPYQVPVTIQSDTVAMTMCIADK